MLSLLRHTLTSYLIVAQFEMYHCINKFYIITVPAFKHYATIKSLSLPLIHVTMRYIVTCTIISHITLIGINGSVRVCDISHTVYMCITGRRKMN